MRKALVGPVTVHESGKEEQFLSVKANLPDESLVFPGDVIAGADPFDVQYSDGCSQFQEDLQLGHLNLSQPSSSGTSFLPGTSHSSQLHLPFQT